PVARSDWPRQPVPGLFSVVEHCCHLRDLEEEGYPLRLRRMLRESTPVLEDFDGGAVAAGRAYPTQDLTQAMQAFAEARSRNLLVLAGLEPGAPAPAPRLRGPRIITAAPLPGPMAHDDARHRQRPRGAVWASGPA